MSNKTFHILVYGCQMNYADSARIRAVLTNVGFLEVQNIDDADIVVFDTCSVRQKSEDKITGLMQDIDKSKKIWLTGCMIQHNMKNMGSKRFAEWNFIDIDSPETKVVGLTKDLDFWDAKPIPVNYAFDPMFSRFKKKFDNLELFFRIDDLGYLPDILGQIWYEFDAITLWVDYLNIFASKSNKLQQNTKTVYVPIQVGCNQFCSYCIVPYARGLEKNRSYEDIMSEVKFHLQNGAQEIVLLGQIVNKHPEFAKILKDVSALPWVFWLRYTSPYPNFYSDEILALHENIENIAPHIHAPVQSGSNKILKKMFRGYTIEQYDEFVHKVQNLKRDISLTTDIIIGFPDESDEDFEASLENIKKSKYDMIYMWIYSPRPGTYAARKYQDNIDKKTKQARWQQMNGLLRQVSLENNQSQEWKIFNVMVNEILKPGQAVWYWDNMKTIIFDTKKAPQVWEFTKVKIISWETLKLKWEEI